MQVPYREKCVKMRFVPRYIFTKLGNESALRSNSTYFIFILQIKRESDPTSLYIYT